MRNILKESNTYGFPSGSVDSGKVVAGGVNGNWDGSMERALEIASFAQSCSGKKNPISSQKRSRVKTASGGVSDHYEGNLSAYAVDLPTAGEEGDKLLACIMGKFKNGAYAGYKGGKWLNINVDGYRYQFGWRVKRHYDHIHVGVKKIGAKTPNSPGIEAKITEIGYDNFPADQKELISLLFDGFENSDINNKYAKIGLASLVLFKTKSGKTSSYKGSAVEQEVKNMMSEIGSKNFKSLDEALNYLQSELGSEFNKTEVKKIANKFTAKVETEKGESSIFDLGKVFSYLKNFTKDLFEDEEEVTNLKEDIQRMNDIMKKNL